MAVLRLILTLPMQTSILLTCQDRPLLVCVALEAKMYLNLNVTYAYKMFSRMPFKEVNLLKPTCYVMHHHV